MNVLFILGTRPEAIKLAPLIRTFNKSSGFDVKVCITAQHREMLDQVLTFFQITPDYDLDLMQPNQSLFQITSIALTKLEAVLDDAKPDLVFVQGDTTTVLAGALASYYKKIKVAHVEAGLRTYEKYAPFPEELNRQLATRLSYFHFAPTWQAKQNLLMEGITENVHTVGNTVIDALHLGLSIIGRNQCNYESDFVNIDFTKRIILVTCHRRENFGKPFKDICEALFEIASSHERVELVYPVHLNPNIRETAFKMLDRSNIHLIDPLDYPRLIWLLSKCHLVLTDSGGLQEEAPALGKPVLVLRNQTERTEGIEAGTACLVGTSKERIVDATELLLTSDTVYRTMANSCNPYGDGHSAERILEIVTRHFEEVGRLNNSIVTESV